MALAIFWTYMRGKSRHGLSKVDDRHDMSFMGAPQRTVYSLDVDVKSSRCTLALLPATGAREN